jgi:hypothetical protein
VLIRDHLLMDLIIVALCGLLNPEFSVLNQGFLSLVKTLALLIFSLLIRILAQDLG